MSMNLHCYEVDLWQTPTSITYMCMSLDPETGEPDGGVKGVKRRYTQWVRGTLNGRWDDADVLTMHKARVKAHIEEIESTEIKEFYIM